MPLNKKVHPSKSRIFVDQQNQLLQEIHNVLEETAKAKAEAHQRCQDLDHQLIEDQIEAEIHRQKEKSLREYKKMVKKFRTSKLYFSNHFCINPGIPCFQITDTKDLSLQKVVCTSNGCDVFNEMCKSHHLTYTQSLL